MNKESPQLSQEKLLTRNHVLHEITRGLCPECAQVVDAQVLLRDGAVFLRKRCPVHGWSEALVSSDDQWYLSSLKYNKPGSIPLRFASEADQGQPRNPASYER